MIVILLAPVLAAFLCFLLLIVWDLIFFVKLIYQTVITSALKKPSSSCFNNAVHYDEIQHQIEYKKKIIIAKEKYAMRKKNTIGNIHIVQRAVVIVGGDFARSPRMMYHAASLSDRHICGHLFDEIVLVGYDEGNLLAEPLGCRAKQKGVTRLVTSETHLGDDYLDETALLNINVDTTSCIMKKVEVPPFLSYWIIGRLYSTIMRTLQLILILLPLCTITSRREKVLAFCAKPTSTDSSPKSSSTTTDGDNDQQHNENEECLGEVVQIVMTSLFICQTPPAIPFLPILQLMVRVVGPTISYFRKMFVINICQRQCYPDNNSNSSNNNNTNEEQTSDLVRNDSDKHQQNTTKLQELVFSFTPRLIVDWHNIGYTLLEIDKRPLWIILMYRFAEKYCGLGDINLTVSHAMKCAMSDGYDGSLGMAEVTSSNNNENDDDKNEPPVDFAETKKDDTTSFVSTIKKKGLKCDFNFPVDKINVVHDRAPAFFSPCSREVLIKDVILTGFVEELKYKNIIEEITNPSIEEMLVLSKTVPEWVLKRDSNATCVRTPKDVHMQDSNGIRGRIIVSSTSWTSDDDYTMLLDALLLLNVVLIAQNGSKSSNLFDRYLWLVITGKGPTRAVFEKQLTEEEKYKPLRDSPFITISTIFLKDYEQYAKMLGGSDVGLSLHASSSGFDLPMKCVDMLGAGLPILALYYPAILELIDERAGWLFKDANELGDILIAEVMGMNATDLYVLPVDVGRKGIASNETLIGVTLSLETKEANDEDKPEVKVEDKNAKDESDNFDDEYDFCGYTPRYSKKERIDKFNEIVAVSSRRHIEDCYWSKSEKILREKSEFVAKNQGIKWSESWEKHVLPSVEQILQHNNVA